MLSYLLCTSGLGKGSSFVTKYEPLTLHPRDIITMLRTSSIRKYMWVYARMKFAALSVINLFLAVNVVIIDGY